MVAAPAGAETAHADDVTVIAETYRSQKSTAFASPTASADLPNYLLITGKLDGRIVARSV